MPNAPFRRSCDHRIRERIAETGNVRLFPELRIPRSTAATWVKRGPSRVVTDSALDLDPHALEAELERLRRQVRILQAVVRLVLTLLRLSGFRLDTQRLPEGSEKAYLLRAAASAERALPLSSALRVLRLSPSRYHAFASAPTWGRLVKERGWRRPRQRKYPAKPKVGVRAARPNEIWHIDTTIIRLLDGTRTYLHAVIDNYSRKILGWTLTDRMDPMSTCNVLTQAGKQLDGCAADVSVFADSGIENINGKVDALLDGNPLRRVLAQVEVSYSNSTIEAWWRSLRHNWLYLHDLDSVSTVRRLVAFYVEQHNGVMPHAAFDGLTPDEVHTGAARHVATSLAKKRRSALETRLERNRAMNCGRCDGTPSEPTMSPAEYAAQTPEGGASQLRTENFRMS